MKFVFRKLRWHSRNRKFILQKVLLDRFFLSANSGGINILYTKNILLAMMVAKSLSKDNVSVRSRNIRVVCTDG